MADNDKSKLRYDDFVSNVQPDPAKPESTIMLSGFVGHGPEGHARIYPDPTLGTWYDVPEGDVVHSMPIADSKLGGSYVWVRASADIKPGNAAPQAAGAPQAAAAGINPTPATHCFVCDPPKAAAAIQPTPTVQTHCFICPPHTQAIHCPTQPVVCDTMQQPTPATRCFICPPMHTQQVLCPTKPVLCDTMQMPTPATHCFICPPLQTQQVWCPTQPVLCNFQHTQPVVCGIVPPTKGCQQGAAGAQPEAVMALTLPNTGVEACSPLCVTPMCPTAWPGCWTAPSGLCAQAPHAAAAAAGPQNTQEQTLFCPSAGCLTAFCEPTLGQPCATEGQACRWTPASTLCAQAPHAAAAGIQPSPAVTACVQPTPATQCFICPMPIWTVNICGTFICDMQQAPHKTPFCTIPPNCPAQTGLVPCPTQPGACTLPVQCYQNTWFACQQGGGQQHPAAMAAAAPLNTAATLCTAQPPCLPTLACATAAPGCWTAPSGLCAAAPHAAAGGMQATPLTLPPWVCGAPTQYCQHGGGQQQAEAVWTNIATKCICNAQPAARGFTADPVTCGFTLLVSCIGCPPPAPAAAGAPAQTPATLCTAPQACFPTLVGCPTQLGVCPTVATGCWTAPSGLCAFAPTPNGVFTPFGR